MRPIPLYILDYLGELTTTRDAVEEEEDDEGNLKKYCSKGAALPGFPHRFQVHTATPLNNPQA